VQSAQALRSGFYTLALIKGWEQLKEVSQKPYPAMSALLLSPPPAGVVRAVLPSLEHLLMEDFESVYEPSDDTFLLCDALEGDRSYFSSRSEKLDVVLEIGSGSGCVIVFLAKLLREEGLLLDSTTLRLIATDVNPLAASVTLRTARANNVPMLEVVQTRLVNGLLDALAGKVDVLLFNPPYVPTDNEEVGGTGIAASWAGGEHGRVVIDEFLPLLPVLLSAPSGRCYLVLVEENKPREIMRTLLEAGLQGEIVLIRQASNEKLQIMRITRCVVQEAD